MSEEKIIFEMKSINYDNQHLHRFNQPDNVLRAKQSRAKLLASMYSTSL